MKKLHVFFLACGLGLVISGCGMDELKKEVENKNKAIKACETEKADLNKKIEELNATLSKKDADFKKAQTCIDCSEAAAPERLLQLLPGEPGIAFVV